jgi:hypothetical protein
MFGTTRFVATYMGAGLVGAAASWLVGAPGVSAGASGALFGVLGAILSELWFYRETYPRRFRRALFGNLLFLALANVAIGFFYPQIDQSAHLGGLVGGALLGLVLSPRAGFAESRATRVVVAFVTLVSAVSLVYAVWGSLTSKWSDSVARYEWTVQRDGEYEFEHPAKLELLEYIPPVTSAKEPSTQELFDRCFEDFPKAIRLSKAKDVGGWHSALGDYVHDDFGGATRFRVGVFWRRDDQQWIHVCFRTPQALYADSVPALTRLLESVKRTSSPI